MNNELFKTSLEILKTQPIDLIIDEKLPISDCILTAEQLNQLLDFAEEDFCPRDKYNICEVYTFVDIFENSYINRPDYNKVIERLIDLLLKLENEYNTLSITKEGYEDSQSIHSLINTTRKGIHEILCKKIYENPTNSLFTGNLVYGKNYRNLKPFLCLITDIVENLPLSEEFVLQNYKLIRPYELVKNPIFTSYSKETQKLFVGKYMDEFMNRFFANLFKRELFNELHTNDEDIDTELLKVYIK